MRFFKEDTTVQQHEAKQPRRFTPMQYIAIFAVMVLGLPVIAYAAAITSFSPNQSISSTSVNTNFKNLNDALIAIDTKLPTLNNIKLSTSVTAIGTQILFTGIPNGVKRVTLSFIGTSTNGSAGYWVQIGPSGGIETTGYTSMTQIPTVASQVSTSALSVYSASSTHVWTGTLTLNLVDAASNTWIASGTSYGPFLAFHSGSKTLSGMLNMLRLTTVNGTDAFNQGKVNVSWEF